MDKQLKKQEKKQRKLELKNKKWKERYGISFSDVKENVKEKKHKGFPKFKEFLLRYKKYTKSYIMFFVFGIMLALFTVLLPMFTENAINSLTNQNWNLALIFFGCYCIATIVNRLLSWAFTLFSTKLNNSVSHSARMDVLQTLTKIKAQKFDTTSSGEIINRSINDANSISASIGNVINFFTQALGGFMYIFYALYLNFWLGLILLTSGLLSFVANMIYQKKFQKNYMRRNMMINDKIVTERSEMLRGIRDVKFLGIGSTILEKFNKTSINSNNSIYDNTKARQYLNTIQTTRNVLFYMLFVVVGILFIQNSLVTLSAFLVLLMYRSNFNNFFNNVNALFEEMQKAEIHAERMMQIFDEKIYPKEQFGNAELKNIKGKIEFKNVSFAYNENHQVFENLSFTINPNECVAFVGKSGQGKSTIASLIPKLYETNKGNIYFDNKNISSLTEQSIRNNISVVQQSPYIFNISIKENLLYAKFDATDEEIATACKQAELFEFIESLPDKFDTLVGEGGIKLSGGQRQRLAIARAFLQNRKIIIFDEATSALDNESQGKIQTAIETLKENRTIIIIAHRLTTVKNCDKIFVVDNKQIVDNGTHKELMKTSKVYKKLYNSEEIEDAKQN